MKMVLSFRYRKRRNIPGGKPLTPMNGMYASSRAGSNSSPDSCGTDMEDDFMMEQQKHSPNMNRNLAISIPQGMLQICISTLSTKTALLLFGIVVS